MKALAARRRWRMPELGIGPQIVVVLLVLGLIGAMAVQPTRQLLAQRNRVAEMSEDLNNMAALNRMLSRRIERMEDPDFIEQQAREQIGLVRPGETAYVVSAPARKAGRSGRRSGSSRTAEPASAPEPGGFVEGFFDFISIH